MYCPSPAMKRKKLFLARVEWLPVTSRSHKCKISIMILSSDNNGYSLQRLVAKVENEVAYSHWLILVLYCMGNHCIIKDQP